MCKSNKELLDRIKKEYPEELKIAQYMNKTELIELLKELDSKKERE